LVNQDAQRNDEVKVDLLPDDSVRVRAYRDELDKLVRHMNSPEEGIGVANSIGLLREKLTEQNILLNNTVTVEAMLPTWVRNFSINFSKHIVNTMNSHDLNTQRITCKTLVVGAGPSVLKDHDFYMADYKMFEGTVICTNKSFRTLVRMGVIPDYVVTIDATEDIWEHFRGRELIDTMKNGKTVFVTSSMVAPDVANILSGFVPRERIVWFNPSVPDEYAQNIDATLTMVSNLPLMDTGGNAGLMALKLALNMGAKKIGLIGMEHCLRLDSSWTNEQARGYEIVYAPEDNQYYAITPVFRGYLESLMQTVDSMRGLAEIINLVKFGPLYTQRTRLDIRYLSLMEFVGI
jgi:hypothetical protein